jgi:hypothetical protein
VSFTIVNDQFVSQEASAGFLEGYGLSLALATDGSAVYYGSIGVDVLDVRRTLHVFPEPIYAASGDVAFGSRNYFDAHTGESRGSLDFTASAYALNPIDADFWAFDASANLLRHLAPNM